MRAATRRPRPGTRSPSELPALHRRPSTPDDPTAHTAAFDSGAIPTGGASTFTCKTAGAFTDHGDIHTRTATSIVVI